ncbi:hypothetical protein BH24ACI3_BH24ACI3_16080 [soil metagenome]
MKTFLVAILISLVVSITSTAQTAVRDAIRLTSIGAPWWVVIDGAGFEVKSVGTKPDGAYFLLFPTEDELNVSLWIEPAAKCKTSVECREFVLNAGNPRWGKFEKLNKASFGKFDYFEFFRPTVEDMPVQMQDMYAQYVAAGYWLDVHISKVLYKPEDKARFEKLLNSIKFVPKGSKSDVPEGAKKIVRAGQNWLGIWDQQKCAESYQSLTSISREAVKQSLWLEYCRSAHSGLGKLRSRELIAITTTISLPAKPDRSGAVLRFQSEFENGNTIEFISLTSEKDGTWTVSNYATP